MKSGGASRYKAVSKKKEALSLTWSTPCFLFLDSLTLYSVSSSSLSNLGFSAGDPRTKVGEKDHPKKKGFEEHDRTFFLLLLLLNPLNGLLSNDSSRSSQLGLFLLTSSGSSFFFLHIQKKKKKKEEIH